MLPEAESYEALCSRFRWRVPARFNIGVAACDAWAEADPERIAIIQRLEDGDLVRYSFGALRHLTNKFANALSALGIERGDRAGILLPQMPEAAIAHLAVYKLGAVAIPLFTLFGPDALAFRLGDSKAKALIATPDGLEKVSEQRESLPALTDLISVGGAAPGAHTFADLLDRASDAFTPVDTAADDPAVVIYTSGTTGNPKGALHGHRVLLGHLPGVEMPQEMFPKPGDLFWTPADWAWIGGLLDALLPSLYHGVPILAYRFPKFDPERAFALMAEVGVRNAFMPPTALKMMRRVERPAERWALQMRSIGSGGETLGTGLLDWGRETFGLTINEFYGQTECNLIVSNCAGIMPVKPGSMGRPVPGHAVAVIDGEGNALPAGQPGVVAVRSPDPVMFLEYLNRPDATAEKFIGDWLVTGDTAQMDEDGYLWFVGRDDDIISSGGYRIGPGEVEDSLTTHPAVAMAAAVGVPDELRGERVKAFVVLNPGYSGDDATVTAIQNHVKTRLAAHEYPRDVEFVPALPLTATGKIKRRELRDHGASACHHEEH